jgi:uncharacterized damage-inducible protein DinB
MFALDVLKDLEAQCEWADSVVLRALLGQESLETDADCLERFRHLLVVQRLYLDLIEGRPVDREATRDLDARALSVFARESHAGWRRVLGGLAASDLDRIVPLPFAERFSQRLGFQVGDATLGDICLQVHTHSTHHRGQICARIRALGAEPPMTDLIFWVLSRRPEACWS